MTFNKKTKRGVQRVIGDFKTEILGPPKKKVKDKDLPKRSTIDVILGKGLQDSSQPEQMNPIVEAMLQTKEAEEKAKKKAPSTRLEQEIERERELRKRREKQWYEEQEGIMGSSQEEKKSEAVLPSSPRKGPGKPKGKAQGIESFRRGKKN